MFFLLGASECCFFCSLCEFKLDYMRLIWSSYCFSFYLTTLYWLYLYRNSVVYRNPVYHQIVFASLIMITTLRVTYILQLSEASQRIPAKAKKTITHFFSIGAALFSLGFLIWNVDNIFCHTLTTWKVSMGWPIAFLLEGQLWFFFLTVSAYTLTLCWVIGHSWWHVLTVRPFFCIFFCNQILPF